MIYDEFKHKQPPWKINFNEMAKRWNQAVMVKLSTTQTIGGAKSVLQKIRFKTAAFLKQFHSRVTKWHIAKKKLASVAHNLDILRNNLKPEREFLTIAPRTSLIIL
jgi:hypothetical protein